MAAAAVSGGAQFQKARFEDQINALMARKIKADSDSVDASKVVKKAEQVLAQANSEYHQKLLQLVFEK